MTDLGAGVVEYPDEEPATNGRVGPGAPRTKLTCPGCGLHDETERSPKGAGLPFLCGSCWLLFDASDDEWRRLAGLRKAAKKRRETPPEPLPPMRSHKTDHVVPIQQRLVDREADTQ